MNAKIKFVVSARLEPSAEFVELEVHSLFANLEEAQVRAQEFMSGASELPKAKPETQIEAIEYPYMQDCICGAKLFKNDLVYFVNQHVYCNDCAASFSFNTGYHDFLGESAIGEVKATI